jgi:hypothetical protein
MEILRELSELTGQGMGTIVSELMAEALPALKMSTQALKIIKDAPREAQQMLARFSNEATVRLAQTQIEFDDVLSRQPAPKRQKRRKPPDGPT